MALDRTSVVRVSATYGGSGAARRDFGRTLFITNDSTLAPTGTGKVRIFSGPDSINNLFADAVANRVVREAGEAFFGQSPRPRSGLMIGRWVDTDTPATYTGTGSVQDLSAGVLVGAAVTFVTITALGSTDFTFDGLTVTVDFTGQTTGPQIGAAMQAAMRAAVGVPTARYANVDVTVNTAGIVISLPEGVIGATTMGGTAATALGFNTAGTLTGLTDATGVQLFFLTTNVVVDFSSTTDYDGIAAVIGTALAASTNATFTNVTVTWNGSEFVIRLESSSRGAITGTVTGTGAAAVGLDSGDITPPEVSETVSEAIDAIRQQNDSFYGIALQQSLASETAKLELDRWVAARRFLLGLDHIGPAFLIPGETTSSLATIAGRQSERTFSVWTASADYKALRVLGNFASVNFAAPFSLPDAKWLTLLGAQADDLELQDQQELDRKRSNYYANFTGGDPILAEGVVHRPEGWLDVRIWLDWAIDALGVAIWRVSKRNRRVPMTQRGINLMLGAINGVMAEGVINGGIAAGSVDEATRNEIQDVTGDVSFDGYLSRGFLIYVGSLAARSDADVASRRAPPFQIWCKGSGAIHFMDVNIDLRESGGNVPPEESEDDAA